MTRILGIIIITLISGISGCSQVASPEDPLKINAVSFVASKNVATKAHVDPVIALDANYVAIMPFGFIRDLETPTIMHNSDRQWFGERKAGAKQYIEMLHQQGISVMLKPQIWIHRGEFTGHLTMKTEQDWNVLEASYREFILTYVALASEVQVAAFCIGTELEQFIIQRPLFWKNLIAEIKKQYSGKLTYAANWDEYKRVPFWNELDYIGVDAYFPVSEAKTPTVEEARVGWQPWKAELAMVSEAHKKPILFTEYGYRSVDYAGKEPWKSDRSMTGVNMEAQKNLTQALYEELYGESWFKGGFVWKWFMEHHEVGGHENTQFTPQNKPVETLIQQQFKAHK